MIKKQIEKNVFMTALAAILAVMFALVLMFGNGSGNMALKGVAEATEKTVEETQGSWINKGTSEAVINEDETVTAGLDEGIQLAYSQPIDMTRGVSFRFAYSGYENLSRSQIGKAYFYLSIQTEESFKHGEYGGFHFKIIPNGVSSMKLGQMTIQLFTYVNGTAGGDTEPNQTMTKAATCQPGRMNRTDVVTAEVSLYHIIDRFKFPCGTSIDEIQDQFPDTMDFSKMYATVYFDNPGDNSAFDDVQISLLDFGPSQYGDYNVHGSYATEEADGSLTVKERTDGNLRVQYRQQIPTDNTVKVALDVFDTPGINNSNYLKDNWLSVSLMSLNHLATPGDALLCVRFVCVAKTANSITLLPIATANGMGESMTGLQVTVQLDAEKEDRLIYVEYVVEENESTIYINDERVLTSSIIKKKDFSNGMFLSLASQNDHTSNNPEEYDELSKTRNVFSFNVSVTQLGNPSFTQESYTFNKVNEEDIEIGMQLAGNTFSALVLNGETLEDGVDYTKEETTSSIRFMLKKESLTTLTEGSYTLEVRYMDAEGTEKTAELSLYVIDAVPATIENTNASFTLGGTEDVSFSFTLNDDTLLSVSGNGIASEQYKIAESKVYIKASYLNSLSAGTYTFTVTSEAASFELTVEVVADDGGNSSGEEEDSSDGSETKPGASDSSGSGCGSVAGAGTAFVGILFALGCTVIKKKN